jgi:hypothetical protein
MKEIVKINKIKRVILILSFAAAAGLTYTIAVFKNIPESFDWDLEEEEDENY